MSNAIVRELVTVLAFKFDDTNLKKFERSIIGFKTKFTLAIGVIGFAFKMLINEATRFSDSILNSNAIARFSKSSIQEVKALENVFSKFDINPEIFNEFFTKLSFGIKEASLGVNNEFRQLVVQSQGAVRMSVNGQLTTAKQALKDILDYAKQIGDESEQLRIVQNIFGVDLKTADAITQLFKLTNSEFDQLIRKETQSAEELKKHTDQAREYKKQINELNIKWTKFSNSLAAFSLPNITGFLNEVNFHVESGGSTLTGEYFKNVIENFFGSFTGNGHVDKVKRQIEEEDQDFARRLSEYQNQQTNNNSASVTNNNRFEFNVPPGTTEQQANFLVEQVKSAINSVWDQKTREVLNNNPQVENGS